MLGIPLSMCGIFGLEVELERLGGTDLQYNRSCRAQRAIMLWRIRVRAGLFFFEFASRARVLFLLEGHPRLFFCGGGKATWN